MRSFLNQTDSEFCETASQASAAALLPLDANDTVSPYRLVVTREVSDTLFETDGITITSIFVSTLAVLAILLIVFLVQRRMLTGLEALFTY